LPLPQRVDAINPFGDPLTVGNTPRVTALAAKHRLPALYLFRLLATNGGLISYGPDIADLFFRAGGYVDKILKGTKPAPGAAGRGRSHVVAVVGSSMGGMQVLQWGVSHPDLMDSLVYNLSRQLRATLMRQGGGLNVL
jgi:hypothetical protein